MLREFTFLLLGLSVGTLLGGAFFHLIPDVFANSEGTLVSFAILAGIFTFFLLEKILMWQHKHSIHSATEEICKDCNDSNMHMGYMVIISDALHNMLDGVLISIAFLTSPMAGIATTTAVLLHEIPQEIGDFGILLHAGFSKTKALIYNFVSALTAFLGAGLVLFFNEFIRAHIFLFTAFASGSLLYIAMTDLVPELHKQNNKIHIILQILTIILGAMIMYALTLIS